MTRPILERFHEKYIPEPNTGCFIWLAGITPNGYGKISEGPTTHLAHRVSYELHVGPIPDGLQIDHKCRVRCCVNPAHLEPVTGKENTKRGDLAKVTRARYADLTHCRRGHEISDDNTYYFTMKGVRCRQCKPCRDITDEARKSRFECSMSVV